jgi:hypothetical protein
LVIIKNHLLMQFVESGWKDLQCIYVQDCCFYPKNNFFKSFAWIGGKMQVEICFTIVGGLYLYNNKFKSMDAWSPWCLNCSCY